MDLIESLIRLVEVLSSRHVVALGTAIRLDAPSIPGEVAPVTQYVSRSGATQRGTGEGGDESSDQKSAGPSDRLLCWLSLTKKAGLPSVSYIRPRS